MQLAEGKGFQPRATNLDNSSFTASQPQLPVMALIMEVDSKHFSFAIWHRLNLVSRGCRRKGESSCLQCAPILLALWSPAEYVQDTEWPYSLTSFIANPQPVRCACSTQWEACCPPASPHSLWGSTGCGHQECFRTIQRAAASSSGRR